MSELQQLSFYSHIEKYIRKDEQLLWVGQPDPKSWAKDRGIFSCALFFFKIFAIGFGIYWMLGIWSFSIPDFSNPDQYFALFGLLIICIPIGLLFTPLWRRREAKKIHYLITNKQLLIVELTKIPMIINFQFKNIVNIISKIENNDIGYISFDDTGSSYISESGERLHYSGFMQAVFPLSEVEALMRSLQERNSI